MHILRRTPQIQFHPARTFAIGLILLGLLASLLARSGSALAGASIPPPQTDSNPPSWPGQTFRFEHLGIEDGLSQSSVIVILQDRQGFLWFGTEDGLNRYDGYSFTVFTPNLKDASSISDRWIQALHEDRAGNLWVGTRLGGLNRYDPRTGDFIRYQHNSADPSSISSNKVNAIYEDASGIIWVGTESGLDWLDPISGVITHLRSNPDDPASLSGNRIKTFFADSRGDIWIGTSDAGLNRYSVKNGSIRRYSFDTPGKNRMCSASILDIAEGPDGLLWLATSDGLARLNPISRLTVCYRNDPLNPQTISSNLIETVYFDSAGRLWVGTAVGLDQYQSDILTFRHLTHDPASTETLSAETVYSIYEDRGGVLWVGTYGGGVNKHDSAQERFAHFRHDPGNPSSLSDNLVFPIHVDKLGTVWIGTYGGGLNRFEPLTGIFTHYKFDPQNHASIANNYIWSIFSDSSGALWVATSRGLSMLDPQSGGFTNYAFPADDPEIVDPGLIYAMAEDSSGSLWLATRHGLGQFDRKAGLFLPQEFNASEAPSAEDRTVSLFIDASGVIWFGTFEKGFYRYSPSDGQLRSFRADPQRADALSHNSVLNVFEDSRGSIWIATAGGGLNRYYTETGTFKAYTEQDGLPNDVVYGVVEDSRGYLWMSTNSGVSRFDPVDETFRNYTVNDGLGSMEFNTSAFAASADGTMYFGSTNGLNAFRPEQIQDSQYSPPIALTSLTVDGAASASNLLPQVVTAINMEYPQNSFEFEFAALGFADPEHNQYAYMLEGFEKEWNILGTRRNGRYTNVPGGEYVLQLKAANSDGVWSQDWLSIPVVVVPPYWATSWFRISLAVGFAALALVAYRLRVRSVEARNLELEQLVRTRTAEIEGLFTQTKDLAIIEERNRLARDLHDSAKQKAFAALAQLGTINGLTRDNGTAHKHLVEAETLVAEVIQELTFLIQEMYPVGLLEKGLSVSVREYVFEWEGRTGIEAEVSIDSARPLDLKIEQAVYRIIQESLANVARHSRATRVKLDLEYGSDCLRVLVADNGCGFDLAHKALGLGLRSMRERAESIAGTIKFESGPDVGSSVFAEVPIHGAQPENNLER